MGLITLAKNFCHWTISVVIAGHLAKTNNIIWRAFWSVLLIVTIIAFCLHCALNIIEYLAFEKTTVIRLYSLPSAPFPAVTICNLNPFKKSALDKSSSLSNLISAYKYTLDKKAITTENAAITSASEEENVRRKRQTCPYTGTASLTGPSESGPQDMYISNCNGGYFDVDYQMCAGSTIFNFENISESYYDSNSNNMEKSVYYCLNEYFCDPWCDAWGSGIEALLNITDCAESYSIYPPDTGEFNFIAKIAETFLHYCPKNDSSCVIDLYKKPSTKYPGNYWYTACGDGSGGFTVGMVMEGCDGATTYSRNTLSYSCPIDFIQIMSDAFSKALDDTDCGTKCVTSCPFIANYSDPLYVCDINQDQLCQYYHECSTTTSVSTTTASITEVATTITVNPTTSTTKSFSTTTEAFTTTSEAPTTTKKETTTTPEATSTEGQTTSKAETTTSQTLTTSKTTTTVESESTTDSGASTKEALSTTEVHISTTLKPFTTTNVDSSSNNPTTHEPSTVESFSSTNEPPTTSVFFTTKLSTIASNSKASTFTAPPSTKIITSSRTLASMTDSLTSPSTKTSLVPTTSVQKTSTQLTTNAEIISTTKLSTNSNLLTTTKASTIPSTNPTTAESTVKTTSTPILTTPLTTKASTTTKKLDTMAALTSTKDTSSLSSINLKTTSILTTKGSTTSVPSTSKLYTSLTIIKSSTSQTQTNPILTASTNDFLYASPTTAIDTMASTKSGTSVISSTSNPYITTISSKDTTSVTKVATTNAELDLTTSSLIAETTPTKNSGTDYQTTRLLTTQTPNNSPVITKVVIIASTKILDQSTTSSSNIIIKSTPAIPTNEASQTSATTKNVFLPSTPSTDDSFTTNIIDLTYSVPISTVNDNIFSNSKITSVPINFTPTIKKDNTNDLSTTKSAAITPFFNTTKGTMGSTTLATISVTSTPKSLISTPATTTKSGSTSSDSKSTLSTASEKMTTPTTLATKSFTTVSNKANNQTQAAKTTTKSSSNPLFFTSIISTTLKSASLSNPLTTANKNLLFTSSSPSTIKNTNQSTITTPRIISSITSSSSIPFQTTLSIPSSNTTDTTTQSSTNDVIPTITDSTGANISLENLSKIYSLNSSQEGISIETNAQQALISIAASLTETEKEALGYKMSDLIQTCNIDGVPCNVDRDFSQIYDVDYGYCYTFNYELFYNTTRMGTNHGLKMVVLSDINEYLATSSEQGIKVVVHYQNQSPFPNVDGYRCATGKAIDLRVIYGIVSRLDAPYGECNDLDKLKELNQPFYFPGTYTVEGCYRSCFQQKISKACNCSDPRFPLPSDLSTAFCQNTDTVKYDCYEKYIEDNGDYYNVEGCTCSIPCNDITYDADVYYSNWPYGTYFYQALCTNSTLLNGTDCQQYYQDNGVLVQVSYAKLGYESMEETPVTSGFDLFNNLAGNTGLWIGFTAVTAAELALIFIQISLWIFTKKTELKEVPSCRRRNYTSEGDLDKQKEDDTASKAAIIGGLSGMTAAAAGNNPFQKSFFDNNGFDNEIKNIDYLYKPKNFANNDVRRRRNSHFATTTMISDPNSLYESIKPVNHIDVYDSQLVAPSPSQSAVNETVP